MKTVENNNYSDLNLEKISGDLQDFIRCRTISYRDDELIDRKEFKKLYDMLPEKFPCIFSNSEFMRLGKTGLLFCIKGERSLENVSSGDDSSGEKNTDEKSSVKNVVLMAHYDVVPVEQDKWKKDAFAAEIENGVMWGRGTLDTKSTFCSVLEAVEYKLKNNWRPSYNLYLSFSGEEEIDGLSCSAIVGWFEKNKICPDFVLDEGGAIVSDVFPGIKVPCAVIGIAEKGSVYIDCTVESVPGHASTPPKHTAVGIAAMGISAIENKRFKVQMTRPVNEMLDVLGGKISWLYKVVFRFFSNLLNERIYAFVHTSCAVTKASGSTAYNVMPATVTFGMNLRLLGKETVDSAIEHLKKAVAPVERKTKSKFTFKYVYGHNPSPVSDTKCRQWEILSDTVKENWGNVIVTPYLMMAASDSNYFNRISDKVYRFSPMPMSNEDLASIHGNNEKIALENLYDTVRFYCRLLEKL